MPWSGGTFSRTDGTRNGSTVWAQAKAAAVKIIAADHDTHDQDLATGINNCITKDGQNSPTANIDWNSKKITNLADASADGDALSKGRGDALYQPLDATLTALAGATTGANKLAYFDGSDSVAVADLTAAGRALLDDADASAQRTTLGLGALAVLDTVDTAQIDDDAVTLAKIAAGTDGELITWDASGNPATVAVGTSGQVLTSNGAGAAPTFQAAARKVVAEAHITVSGGSISSTDVNVGFSSIVRNSAGSFTFTFSSALGDAHYFVLGMAQGQSQTFIPSGANNKATTDFTIRTVTSGLGDPTALWVRVYASS